MPVSLAEIEQKVLTDPLVCHTVYPVLITIPECFSGQQENTTANAGLRALSAFLEDALSVQGYHATVAWGGVGNEIVVAITRTSHA